MATSAAAPSITGRATQAFVASVSGSTYTAVARAAKAPTITTSPWAKLMSWMIP